MNEMLIKWNINLVGVTSADFRLEELSPELKRNIVELPTEVKSTGMSLNPG